MKDILAHLKPALAGLIVDHKAGPKEAYATFIHLVEKGYIDFKVRNKKYIFSKKRDPNDLCVFEKQILYMFLDKECLSEDEVKKKLEIIGESESFTNHVLIYAIENGIYKDEAFDEEEVLEEKHSENTKDILTIIFLIPFALMFIFGVISAISLLGGALLSLIYVEQYFSAIIVLIFILLVILRLRTLIKNHLIEVIPTSIRKLKRRFSLYDVSKKRMTKFMSKESRAYRRRYLRLLKWLEEHPLSEVRWSNEFLPYSIAFGLYRDFRKFPK